MKHAISEKRAVGTSFAVSLSDVLFNFFVGIITNSTVMFSQALQGLSDLVTAGILYRGVALSSKKADASHPFGRGREVFFYVLIAGLFMFAGTGVASVLIGIGQIQNPSELEKPWLAVAMLSFGYITNLYSVNISRKRLKFNRINKKSMRKLVRSSLIETKATLIVDLLGTLAALFGFVAISAYVVTGSPVYDGIGSVVIGLLMMSASLLLMLDAKSLIVGRAVSAEASKKITTAARKVKGVVQVLDLKTMFLGSGKILVILEVNFEDSLNANQIEKQSDAIKKAVKHAVPSVASVQVESETPENEFNDR